MPKAERIRMPCSVCDTACGVARDDILCSLSIIVTKLT